MQTLIEELIFKLINNNKLSYKVVGMELANEFTKEVKDPKKRLKKLDNIENKLFKIFLSNISEDDALTIVVYQNKIFAIADDIYYKSGFTMNRDYSFTKGDVEIIRTENGYEVKPDTVKTQMIGEDFINRYEKELKRINEVIDFIYSIINGGYKLKENADKGLIDLILQFLNTSRYTKSTATPIYKQKK